MCPFLFIHQICEQLCRLKTVNTSRPAPSCPSNKQTYTLLNASTYRPAVLADPVTSFFPPPPPLYSPRCPPLTVLRYVIHGSQHSSSSALFFTLDEAFAFISIFSRITCQLWQQGVSFMLDLASQKKKIRRKKNQCLPTTLSLMCIYIDNFFFIALIPHVLEQMRSPP